MKPKTTRRFHVEYKRPDGWWRYHPPGNTLAKIRKHVQRIPFLAQYARSRIRIAEQISTVKMHKL